MRVRITKRQFYDAGGFADIRLFRKHNGRHWQYYKLTE
jgi:hypothetical protein